MKAKTRAVASPKVETPKIETMARKHAMSAIAALAAVMQDETATPAARISAASTILQWGFGRPAASVKGKPGDTGEQIIRLSWGEA